MIEVKNISKQFKLSKKQKKETGNYANYIDAVDNVSFNCNPGRIFTILGPNGAGKTTILRMIATILKPSSGNINVAGFDATKDGKNVRAKIGFLTGTTNLYERLTGNELLKYFADLYNIEPSVFNRRKIELYELLEINFGNKRISQLSSGMKQKLSIARTIIHDPEIIVFDEPTTGLDVITAKNIIELIRSCKEQNKTVIFSSHIMSEVDLLCDDLAIIHKGKLLYNDTMENLRKNMKSRSLTEEFISIVNKN